MISLKTIMNSIYKKKNLKGKNLVLYKKKLESFTQEQRDILIGTLLGDSSMQAMLDSQNSNIKFEQSILKMSYIHYLYSMFFEWTGSVPTIRKIKGGQAKKRKSIWFKTYAHPSLQFYKNVFYKKDKDNKQYKIVPKLIHRWLTARALAYWYMDDGSYSSRNGDYYLHTQGFCIKDVQKLSLVLNNNFSIQNNIHKDRGNYKLYIRKESNELFKKTIESHLLPCFYYKLHSSSQ